MNAPDYTPEVRCGRHFRCKTLRHRECPGGWADPIWMPCGCPCHESTTRQRGDHRADDAERERRSKRNAQRRRKGA